MTQPTTEAEIRELVGRRLGHPVDDAVWQYMSDHAYADDVLGAYIEGSEEGREALSDLIEHYVEVEQLALRGGTLRRPPREPQHLEPDERLKALSRRLARLAAEEPSVIAFRAEVLGGRLLAPEDVEAWVKREAEADGDSALYLGDVAVPPGHTVEHGREGIWVEPPLTLSRESPAHSATPKYLALGIPGHEGVFHLPVAYGGALDRLRCLSEALVRDYGWRGVAGEAQAALFVLTGQAPVIPRATITWHVSPGSPIEGRIALDLDPTLGPLAVANLYRQARAQMPLRRRSRRYRPLSPKHGRLAEWADKAGSWRERMEDWNRACADDHPDWHYSDPRNFARDVTHAARQLFGQEED